MQEKHDDISSRPAMGELTAQGAKPAEHDCREAALNHERLTHASAEFHHHHSHASASHHAGGHHLLQVENLSMGFSMYDPDEPRFFRAKKRLVPAIKDLSVSVHAGEVMAVVGASGSGKTLLADAIFALFEPNAEARGTVWFDGEHCGADSLARLRGRGISLVPQSVSHLDPLMKVGKQVRGVARDAADAKRRERKQRELFERYGLAPEVEEMYPFELSGGMARRVLLCCALIDEPRLIVADEPTPGLDLDLAVKALDDLRAFADEGGGVLLITHDIELALRVADRIAVFKDGTVVEETSVAAFESPETLRHPFSRELWHAVFGSEANSGSAKPERRFDVRGRTGEKDRVNDKDALRPDRQGSRNEPDQCLEACDISFAYPGGRQLFNGLELRVEPGERVALTAPSGFGKTTLCRILAGYLVPAGGSVTVDGEPLPNRGALPVQLIGQHPETMVDPRMRMRAIMEEAGPVSDEIVQGLGIREAWMRRHPHELSGGELQRFCIVRALAANPRYLICDETTAMFDAVAQAEIWRYLVDYTQRHGIGLVLVSHSPSLVERVATRVVKLN